MPNWTAHDIKAQYERAELAGWIPTFISTAKEFLFEPDILMAVASRETNMKNIRGDYHDGAYHGFGVMQADIGSFPEWIKSNAWTDPLQAIEKGGEILHSKRHEVANLAKAAEVELSDDELLWISLAAYNHGSAGSFRDFNAFGDPDKKTTGHDYGADTLKRAKAFRSLLSADNFLEPVEPAEQPAETPDEAPAPAPSSPAPVAGDAPKESPPAPGPTETVAPAQPVVTQTIAAIPPAQTTVPGALKKIGGAVSGLSLTSIIGGMAIFKDRPDLLNIVVLLVKWTLICGSAVGAVVAVFYFIAKLHNASLANQLNIARLQNAGDKLKDNVDFSGWKVAKPEEPK